MSTVLIIVAIVAYIVSVVFLAFMYDDENISPNLWAFIVLVCPILNTILLLVFWCGVYKGFLSLRAFIKEIQNNLDNKL